MEVDEEERTQNETATYHSLRTSLSLDDLRTALHHSCASPCKTASSLTRIVEGPDRWRQLLRVVDQEELLADNRPDSDSAVQRALETVIASIRDENEEPSLTTARRHSFQLSDGDTFALDVPSTTLDQYDDPWAPPNTPVEEQDRFLVDCTTTCSTMESISPSASRERISGEVAEYLLVKGGAWHANVNDSVRVEVTTPDNRDKNKRGAAERSRSRSPHRIESTTCRWEDSAEIRDCGQ